MHADEGALLGCPRDPARKDEWAGGSAVSAFVDERAEPLLADQPRDLEGILHRATWRIQDNGFDVVSALVDFGFETLGGSRRDRTCRLNSSPSNELDHH